MLHTRACIVRVDAGFIHCKARQRQQKRILLLLSALLCSAEGFSGGGGEGGAGQNCDAINVCALDYGITGGAGNPIGASCPPGMHLVAPPNRSSVYEVRGPPMYAPNELIEITVRVTAARIVGKRNAGSTTTTRTESAKFIGLLLYAVRAGDATETKVGSWELPAELTPKFTTPPDPGCAGRALMHLDANPKPYRSTFIFRSPAVGTGSLVFRALVKQGDTNGGAFYWPVGSNGGGPVLPPTVGMVVAGDLTISEGAPRPGTSRWVEAATAGESCDAACAARGLGCDAAATQSAAESTTLPAGISGHFLCQRPLISSCDAALPARTSLHDRFCWVRASTCPADTLAQPCAAVSIVADHRRLCACTAATGRRLDRPLAQATVPATRLPMLHPKVSNASSPCPATRERRRLHDATNGFASSPWLAAPIAGLIVLMVLTLVVVVAMRRARAPSSTILLLGLATSTEAHNWVNSPRSRASKASTVRPCRQRSSPDPHVRTVAGREFAVEWMTGHPGSYHWFIVVAAESEPLLNSLDERTLHQYITDAPTPNTYFSELRHKKVHFAWTGRSQMGQGEVSNFNALLNQGNVPITPSDPDYIQRPAAFHCSAYGRGANGAVVTEGNGFGGDRTGAGVCQEAGGMTAFRYPESDHGRDAHATYTSTSTPWLLAVHRVLNTNRWPKQFDHMPMEVPAGAPPGSYIVYAEICRERMHPFSS